VKENLKPIGDRAKAERKGGCNIPPIAELTRRSSGKSAREKGGKN